MTNKLTLILLIFCLFVFQLSAQPQENYKYHKAVELIENDGDLKEVRKLLNENLQDNTKHIMSYVVLTQLDMHEGNYSAALACIDKALKLNYKKSGTSDALLQWWKAVVYEEMGELEKANCDSADRAAMILFQRYQPKVVVVTQGKEGGVLYDGVHLTHYPAFPVDAVDTNGSGDVFHGAFAFALTKGWDYLHCCVFSSAVSALKCTQVGARKSIPDYDAVIDFLRSRDASY